MGGSRLQPLPTPCRPRLAIQPLTPALLELTQHPGRGRSAKRPRSPDEGHCSQWGGRVQPLPTPCRPRLPCRPRGRPGSRCHYLCSPAPTRYAWRAVGLELLDLKRPGCERRTVITCCFNRSGFPPRPRGAILLSLLEKPTSDGSESCRTCRAMPILTCLHVSSPRRSWWSGTCANCHRRHREARGRIEDIADHHDRYARCWQGRRRNFIYRFARSTEGANRSITPGPQRIGTRRAKLQDRQSAAAQQSETGRRGYGDEGSRTVDRLLAGNRSRTAAQSGLRASPGSGSVSTCTVGTGDASASTRDLVVSCRVIIRATQGPIRVIVCADTMQLTERGRHEGGESAAARPNGAAGA